MKRGDVVTTGMSTKAMTNSARRGPSVKNVTTGAKRQGDQTGKVKGMISKNIKGPNL